MNTDDFAKFLRQKGKEVAAYAQNQFPDKAGQIALRFIDSNFRKQGWQGQTFQPWPANKKRTTILVKSGILRRGNFYTIDTGLAHVQNNVKYAAIHNNGFHGVVDVKSHFRRIQESRKVFTGRYKQSNGEMETRKVYHVSGISSVKAHSRKVNMPQRKFFPTRYDDSPVLAKDMQIEISNALKNIVK